MKRLFKRIFINLILLIVVFLTSACSLRRIAVNSLANTLSDSGSSVFAADEDPELVGDALPVTLKVMEMLLQTAPDNKALLVAAASGFVQYGHGYVLRPAESREFTDLAAARMGRQRAKRLFLRARGYGLRALEIDHPGISQAIATHPEDAVRQTTKEDIPALYWTGAAWGSAISISKNDMALVSDLVIVQAIMTRALSLDDGWSDGAIHEFFIVFSTAGMDARGGIEKAETHFVKAMEFSEGRSISPLVSLAESVCVIQQDRRRFVELLNRTLDFDVNQHVENRLSNILAQRKAASLLDRIDDLFFIEDLPGNEGTSGDPDDSVTGGKRS